MIFRYYPKIHFDSHFRNQKLCEKIPWHQKNFIFEARLLLTNTNSSIIYYFDYYKGSSLGEP